MQIKFTISLGLVGCHKSEVVEVEDDLTEEEIEEYWKEWVWEHIDGSWGIV